jgi:hypothetical protein
VPAVTTSPRRSSAAASKGTVEGAPLRRGPFASRSNKAKLPFPGEGAATTPQAQATPAPAPTAGAHLSAWAAGLRHPSHASAAPLPISTSGTLSPEAGPGCGCSPRYTSVSGTSTPRDFDWTPGTGDGDIPPALWRARSARLDGERSPRATGSGMELL